jgi:hypothetical protein
VTGVRERVANLRIGPIEARIEPTDVLAYARATSLAGRLAADGSVPATFPAIWLWHPRAAAAVAEAVKDASRAPVLTAQRFSYRRRLSVGETYRFEIARFADPADPDGIVIEAQVATLDGDVAATFAATYRLFAVSTTKEPIG